MHTSLNSRVASALPSCSVEQAIDTFVVKKLCLKTYVQAEVEREGATSGVGISLREGGREGESFDN